ncbi:MAG TPA: glutamate 5-kinase [Clostridia bacterium]|jgi:glutamate 5-kinase|nr:glutamate 5-kinase [Clostridia bacterium]
MYSRGKIKNARRIVVKVGTSTLTYETGKINFQIIDKIACQIANLMNQGREVILVTSAAISVGVSKFGLAQKPESVPEKQAMAAVGQGILMQYYEKFFSEYGQIVAQVLLTKEDVIDRKKYLNIRNTLFTLLKYRVVPIINENDTVAVDEIKFGDNDTLSALVASVVEADLLIILSDIDGLFTADPKTDPQAKLIEVVDELTPEIESLAGGVGSWRGSGGMTTKIQAAKIGVNSNVSVVIANGADPTVIEKIIDGQPVGTYFVPKEHKLEQRKRWIAFGLSPQGILYVDSGAEKALVNNGRSLLPSGIVDVKGDFEAGQAVQVLNLEGKEIARGIVNYSSDEIQQVKGLKSSELQLILGYNGSDVIIHRDNLVLM